MSPTPGSKRWRNLAGVLAFAALSQTACEDVFYADAGDAQANGRMRIAFSATTVQGGREAALAKADRLHLVLTPQGGGATPLDTTIVLNGGGTVDVAVPLEGTSATFSLEAEVRQGAQPLFRGAGSVKLKIGETTPATIDLASIAAGIVLRDPVLTLTAIGAADALKGAVVFATGDTIPNAALSWTSLDPDILEVTPAGQARAKAEGTARVRARHEGMTAQGVVRVDAVVTLVEVEPTSLSLVVGSAAPLKATAKDTNGNVLARAITWQSQDPAIAEVDGTGRVLGKAQGNTTVTATAGGRASAPVPVQVVSVPVARIGLTPPSLTLLVGQTTPISAQAYDAQGNPLTGRAFSWLVRNSGIVSSSGNTGSQISVTGLAVGTTWLVVTSESVTDSARVNVCVPVISASPTSVGYSANVGQNPSPQSRTITVGNSSGCGSLAGLQTNVVYTSGQGGWLAASPSANGSSVTLTATAATLPAGNYSARVDLALPQQQGVATASVTVTLIMAAGPVISNLQVAEVGINHARCAASVGGNDGSLYTFTVSYSDANGNVSWSGTPLTLTWLNHPSGFTGTSVWDVDSSTGNSFIGTVTTEVCIVWGGDTSITFTWTLQDTDGVTSNSLSVNLPKPTGAHSYSQIGVNGAGASPAAPRPPK